jgi:hypothetical protein
MRRHERPGLTLVLNPASDWRFALRASELAAPGVTLESLQATLRHEYPNLVVRRRELSGESTEIWYVYRDGHWVPPDPSNTDALHLRETTDVES